MQSSGPYTLFAVRGWGSALAEAMLALCEAPLRIEEVKGFDRPGAARDRLLCLNALAQLPTLLLPDGTVMTESAAIALLLAERHPQAELAPAAGSALRPTFLRRLVWIVANVYPTFTYGYYPERWVSADEQSLRLPARQADPPGACTGQRVIPS
ncbi:MAG TPA: glutathione S-transferase N-terminal domain-containing protein [Steroidobacteraceae bacterium]|nr:glutathione S-transferase N-terminal domain-containing protein [Steroidobacteraceae bacterium]